MAHLRIIKGNLTGSIFELGEESISIGRNDDCTISLDCESTSHQHAEVFSRKGKDYIKDLGSRNGTWVNRKRVADHVLKNGDSIKIGTVKMVYDTGEPLDEEAIAEEVEESRGDVPEKQVSEKAPENTVEPEVAEVERVKSNAGGQQVGACPKWLGRRIDEWKAQGILSDETAHKLVQFEISRPRRVRVSFTGMVLGLGAILIGIGAILLVSYNWENIPNMIRQAGYLSVLLGIALGCGFSRRAVVSGALEVVWMFWLLAGIGLWTQIYQLPKNDFWWLLVVLFLSLPMVWLGKRPFTAAMHAAIFCWAMFVGAWSSRSMISVQDVEAGGEIIVKLTVFVVLWGAMAMQVRTLAGARAKILFWITLIVFFGSLSVTDALDIDDDGIIMLLVAGLAMLPSAASVVLRANSQTTSLLTVAASGFVLYLATFFIHGGGSIWFGYRGVSMTDVLGLIYSMVIVVLGLLSVWMCPMPGSRGIGGAHMHAALLSLPGVLGLMVLMNIPFVPVGYLANVFLLVYVIYHMHAGVMNGNPKLVYLSFGLVVILIITRVIDYFGSLLDGGVAFIVTGGLLVGFAWLMHKGLRQILKKMERGTKS